MAADKDPKGIMDVSKPGSSAPSSSSRPIITTHKPALEDPMISKPAAADEKEDVSPPSVSRKVISPIGDDSSDEASQPDDTGDPASKSATSTDGSAEQPSNDEPADTETSPETSDSEETSDSKPAESSDEAVVNSLAEQAGSRKKGAVSEEEQKRQAELEKLIEEKTYFVPTSSASKKKGALILVLLAVVLLLVVGAYLIIDLGLVETGFNLPFRVIGN